ncbi:hypothetical protein Taro_036518, partial [Colocasia esculenta]|nr:hypothetical protein [Colocasia esculenta]
VYNLVLALHIFCSLLRCPSVTSKLIQLKICQAYLMKVFIFHLDYPFAMFIYHVFHFSASMLEFPPKSSSHDFALMYIYQLPFLLCPPIWGAIFCSLGDRTRLFSMINDLPTVFEVVTDRKQAKEKSGIESGSKSKLSTKRSSDGLVKNHLKPVDEEYDVEDDEHSETLCGICGSNYNSDEFWICCDICERWFHGKCVKIMLAKAESIKQIVSGLLSQPEWTAWDQTVEYCAFAYNQHIVISSLRPQYRYLGDVTIPCATGAVWRRRQLFVATPTTIE